GPCFTAVAALEYTASTRTIKHGVGGVEGGRRGCIDGERSDVASRRKTNYDFPPVRSAVRRLEDFGIRVGPEGGARRDVNDIRVRRIDGHSRDVGTDRRQTGVGERPRRSAIRAFEDAFGIDGDKERRWARRRDGDGRQEVGG